MTIAFLHQAVKCFLFYFFNIGVKAMTIPFFAASCELFSFFQHWSKVVNIALFGHQVASFFFLFVNIGVRL